MKKGFIKSLFVIACLSFCTNASADGFEIDGVYYVTTSSQTVTVFYLTNSEFSGELNIPEEVEYNNATYTVTAIKDRAFWYCSNLTKVTIPNTITAIGDEAFYFCI